MNELTFVMEVREMSNREWKNYNKLMGWSDTKYEMFRDWNKCRNTRTDKVKFCRDCKVGQREICATRVNVY